MISRAISSRKARDTDTNEGQDRFHIPLENEGLRVYTGGVNPSKALAAALSLLVCAGPAWSETLCGQEREALAKSFVAGTASAPSGQEPECRAIAGLVQGRPPGEADEAFEARWRQAQDALQLAPEQAEAANRLYRARRAGAQAARAAAASPAGRSAAVDEKKAARIGGRARRMAEALGRSAEDAGAGVIAGEAQAGARPPAAETPQERARRLNAQPPPQKGLTVEEVPGVERLHAMGSLNAAPAPTVAMRAESLWAWGAKDTVKQDLATVRAGASGFDLPPEAQTGLASSQAPLGSFVQWVANVKDSDLPTIEYGILKPGEIGRYERNVFSKSKITLNISIRDAEPQARAAVLFHELYHYWDNEVERLDYGNVAYGYIDPAHRPEHEYDAYYMTALYWKQKKPEGSSSALSRFLDELPSERDQVTSFVEGNLKVIKDK